METEAWNGKAGPSKDGPEENGLLYKRLRRELLRVSRHHREASAHPSFVPEHRGHLRTAQRQLGSLRQAYRRTREVLAWETWRKEKEAQEGQPLLAARRRPGTGPLREQPPMGRRRSDSGPLLDHTPIRRKTGTGPL